MESPHVPDLYTLRTGDVRRRGAPGRLQPLIADPVLGTVRQALDAFVIGASRDALFHHARNLPRLVPRDFLSPVPAEGGANCTLKEEPVGDRRGPGRLLDPLEDVRGRPSSSVAAGLGRRGCVRGAKRSRLPWSAANDLSGRFLTAARLGFRPGRALTRMLLVP